MSPEDRSELRDIIVDLKEIMEGAADTIRTLQGLLEAAKDLEEVLESAREVCDMLESHREPYVVYGMGELSEDELIGHSCIHCFGEDTPSTCKKCGVLEVEVIEERVH